MNSRQRLRRARGFRGIAIVGAVGAVLGLVSGAASAQAPTTNAAAEADIPATVPAATAPASVPAAQRGAVLGSGWQTSTDRALATSGDVDGFHLLIADAAQGYAWRTLATLSEPGIEADQWIGNMCVTGSGRRAVVVYAPRTFTNKEDLAARGGFTAIVDLTSGAVTKLPIMTTLAYYNPGCGAAEQAVLTQEGTEAEHKTRLIPLDTTTAALGGRIEVPGQLTSAVPTAAGIVAADNGKLVRVDAKGTRRILALTTGVPFRLAADANGGVVFLEQHGTDQAQVRRSTVPAGTARGAVATLASGTLTGMDVASGKGGRVFLTGAGTRTATALPASVSTLAAPVGATPSLQGSLAVTAVEQSRQPGAANTDPAAPQPFNVTATAIATGRSTTFSILPGAAASAKQSPSGRALTPALTVAPKSTGASSTTPSRPRGAGGAAPTGPVAAAGDPHSPADFADRYCSVPRNDPANQAMQPKPRQVEWAVDQAVRNVLTVSRPANWKNLGMPAYTPQGLFGGLTLNGGGFVPSQIMLGVAAQESNLWEAARFALPGSTANPLIGNYFGNNIYNADTSDDWTINWANADCGYGVTQVTDGMRLAGHTKPGETAYAYQTQRAVGLDFAVNIAAGLKILETKWNQTRGAGLTINNGDSSKIENWYLAVWAYNSGFHDNLNNGTPWGLGWANNPANPHYPANRDAFLDVTYNDAAHPQDWPYEEKVIGWAGHPLNGYEDPNTPVVGYRAAWWNGGVLDPDPAIDRMTPGSGAYNRRTAQAPPRQFCDASNNCAYGTSQTPNAPDVVGEPAGPCQHKNSAGQYDLQCWWHFVNNTWKTNCALTCGNELLRFDPGYAYQDDGNSYPPNCSLTGLPSNALVIDDVPAGTAVIRGGCSRPGTDAGTFTFTYKPDGAGQYPGKMDTHQLGAGFGGHFWFTHTRTAAAEGGKLEVGAAWQFSATQTGWGRVLVHLPDLGAQTALARYVVTTQYGDRVAVVSQPGATNRWISIGVWKFNNKPKVTLSSVTPDGTGDKDVAFDAVAFQPIASVQTIRILHWNLDGAKDNHGDDDVADRFVQEILADQPDIVSMNEICQRQFDRVSSQLTAAGYLMDGYYHASQIAVPNCFTSHMPETRTSAGNAILMKGNMISHQGWMFDGDEKLQERSTLPGETRSIACVTARIDKVLTDIKACSAHLQQRDDTQPNPVEGAQKELREIARVFGPQAKTAPFVLAGDMNIPTPPADASLAYLYPPAANTADWTNSGQFDEVNQQQQCISSPTCEISQGGEFTHRGNNGQKLDYVFGSRWQFVVPVGRVSVNRNVGTCAAPPVHDCSDHWMFYSELQLPVASGV